MFHYNREGGVEFIKSIMYHPRVKFAFYTSRKFNNVISAFYKSFEKDYGHLYGKTVFIFGSEYNKPN